MAQMRALGSSLKSVRFPSMNNRRIIILVAVTLSVFIFAFVRANLTFRSLDFIPHSISELTKGKAPEPPASDRPAHYDPHLEALSMKAAGNATLGFESIRIINVPNRWDRIDAATLQAWLSGLQIQEVVGVTPDKINVKGMPPTERPGSLLGGELGCWRSHANIWVEILQKRLGPVLILEADASWDINTRAISSLLNKNFVKFLGKIKSEPRRTFWPKDAPGSAVGSQIKHNPDDPWLSEHWDMLMVGECGEGGQDEHIHMVWDDPDVTPGFKYGPLNLGRERAIRVSGGPVCTTAYAISQRGAAKLLVRTAMDLEWPIDVMMNHMVNARELLTYDVLPVMFAQWGYLAGLGISQRGSDIHDKRKRDLEGATVLEDRDGSSSIMLSDLEVREEDKKEGDKEKPKDPYEGFDLSGWETAWKRKTVWENKGSYRDMWAHMKTMALEVAWKKIFSDEDLVIKEMDVPDLPAENSKRR